MHNVTNPIIIDQNYCDSDKSCHEQVLILTVDSNFFATLHPQEKQHLSDICYFVPCRDRLLLYVIYITETYMEPVLQKLPSVLFAVKLSVAMEYRCEIFTWLEKEDTLHVPTRTPQLYN